MVAVLFGVAACALHLSQFLTAARRRRSASRVGGIFREVTSGPHDNRVCNPRHRAGFVVAPGLHIGLPTSGPHRWRAGSAPWPAPVCRDLRLALHQPPVGYAPSRALTANREWLRVKHFAAVRARTDMFTRRGAVTGRGVYLVPLGPRYVALGERFGAAQDTAVPGRGVYLASLGPLHVPLGAECAPVGASTRNRSECHSLSLATLGPTP